MRDNVHSLKITIAALIAATFFCTSSTSQATSTLNNITNTVNNTTNQVNSTLSNTTNQVNSTLNNTVNNITSTVTQDVGSQLNGLTSQLNGVTSQVGSLTQGITGSLSGITSQVGNLTQGITNGIGNPSQLTGLSNQISGLTNQLGTVTNSISGLTNQLGGLTSQISSLTSQISSLQGSITSQLSDITQGMTSQLSGLTSQLGGLTSQLNGLTSQLGGLNNQLSGLTSLGSEVQGLSSQITQATQTIGQAMQAVNSATQALGSASSAISSTINSAQSMTQLSSISMGGGDNPKYDPCPAVVCTTTTTPGKDMRFTNAIKQSLQGAMLPIDNTATPADNANASIDPGLQGSMPSSVMPNKSTPKLSLVQTYPWLYKDIDKTAQGVNYIQTANGTYNENVNSPYQKAGTSTVDTQASLPLKCIAISANCSSGSGSSTPDYANLQVLARLQRDSCSNQYALSMAMNPGFIFSPTYRSHQYPYNESVCQPLKMVPLPCIQNELGVGPSVGGCKEDMGSNDQKLYDYRAWGYLEIAWATVIQSNYTPNGGQNGGDWGNAPVITGTNAVIKGPGIPGSTRFGQPLSTTYPGGTGEGDTTSYSAQTNPQLIRVNDLAQHPYERLWDPTHPYSPRWDFKYTDRDYTPIAHLNGEWWWGYDDSTSPCIVRCASVPVDILSFRATEFDTCMRCRLSVNTDCFWTQVVYLMTYLPPPIDCPGESESQAVQDTLHDTLGCHSVGLGNMTLTCKTTLSLANLWPPCSTKFDHHLDNVPPMCAKCVADANDNNPNDGVKKCCDDLAHALAPINTLKIRNIKENPELQPVPEGYDFKNYFGNHMPYMRWWDTGTAAGGRYGQDDGDQTNYNPYCDMGQYDTFVGVGIEGSSCKYGGGAGLSYQCINIPANDALTSWEELKQYQETTMREYGLNCIAQYEKIYKPFGAEDGVLHSVGGYFISAFPVMDSSGNIIGSDSKTNQWPLGWRGYLTSTTSSTSSSSSTSSVFPCFGAQSSSGGCQGTTGLDNATIGDIIFLTPNDVAPNVAATSSSNAPTGANGSVMPFAAVVQNVSWAKGTKPGCGDYVDIVSVNNGKYPDACGNTNYMGIGMDSPRRVYKNSLPPSTLNSLYPTGTQMNSGNCLNTTTNGSTLNSNNQGNCNDPNQAQCTFGETMWNAFHVYTPIKDIRGYN